MSLIGYRNRLLVTTLVPLLTIFVTPRSFAGGVGSDGGGGKGVLCDGKLRTLDLYEAEELYHLRILRDHKDLDSALSAYFPKFQKYVSPWLTQLEDGPPAYSHRQELNWSSVKQVVTDRFKNIPEGQHLPLTPDAIVPTLPANCQIVQVFVLHGPNVPDQNEDGWDGPPSEISRDNFYWNMLSPDDQAALILHELLYDIQGLRFGANSDDVRRIIGLIFSNQELTQLHKFLVEIYTRSEGTYNVPVTECRSTFRDKKVFNSDLTARIHSEAPDNHEPFYSTLYVRWSEFYMVDELRDGVRGVGFYFDYLHGIRQIMETSAFVPGLSRKQLFDTPKSEVNVVAVNEITGKEIHLQISFEGWHSPDWTWRMHLNVRPDDLPALTPDIADRFNDSLSDGGCDSVMNLGEPIPRQK